MKVFVVETWGKYVEDGSEVAGVYYSLEAAKADYPHIDSWREYDDGEAIALKANIHIMPREVLGGPA